MVLGEGGEGVNLWFDRFVLGGVMLCLLTISSERRGLVPVRCGI